MAQLLTREEVAQQADIHAQVPTKAAHEVDRTFELPTGLYATTVGLFLAYLGLMAVGFAHRELIIPMVIFAFFIVAGFGIPAIWTMLAPEARSKPKSWSRFQAEGIMTAYGRTSARDATVQVLILPVLIFLWGIAAVTIAALV